MDRISHIEQGGFYMAKKRILCLIAVTLLALALAGLTGCNSSSGGKTGGGTATATSNPYDGDWTIVAAVLESGVVYDANGSVKVSGNSMTINGSYASTKISTTGKYSSKQDGSYAYKLGNSSDVAVIGKSSSGIKPYAVVLSTSNGDIVSFVVEKTTSPNKFTGRWKISKVTDNTGTYSGEEFERVTRTSFSLKITPGGYAVMTYGGKTTVDVYSTSGNTLTITDAADGTRIPFSLSGNTLRLDFSDMIWELTKA